MQVLLTGGLGFIGSHVAIELIINDYNVVIIDNLCNSSIDVLDKIKIITNKKPIFYEGDFQNISLLEEVFTEHKIECVIHLAAYKSVSDSLMYPLKYYENNVSGLITLLKTMEKFNIDKFIYSSSATVYKPSDISLSEDSNKGPINPYGQTKLIGEQILQDIKNMKITILRYFNPVGCHESGLIGDNPLIPTNLFPYIMDVIRGKKDYVEIYGCDYDTHDGTPIRDYIHISDLAIGHRVAMENLQNGLKIYNLGTGKGYSVLDVVLLFNRSCKGNTNIKYKFVGRRNGDAPSVFANPSLIEKELGWKVTKTLEDMVLDSLKFVKMTSSFI